MPKFALNFPYFILMLCLMVALVGVFTVATMPVDLFPTIDMPVVVVATFYNGMPPQQIEADITNTFERFFTLAANVDHSESRSLTGVSLIKIYFKPGTDPNAALSNVANLAMALDPQFVVIGGGLMDPEATTEAFRGRYLGIVRDTARPNLWPAQQTGLSIVPATLGDLSQAIGAALVALYRSRH